MEVGTHPHYSKQRRLSSDCYYPQEIPENATVERSASVTPRRRENATAESSTSGSGESSTASRIGPGPERDTAHDDRHQHPLRAGRSRPGPQRRRHRRHAPAGSQRTGLIRDIDPNLHLLKRHLPYHESDHVLNIAFNILAGGKRHRAPRTAAQRRGLSQRPGRRAHPRPHHRRATSAAASARPTSWT